MRIAVTGSSGLIGSALVEALALRGEEVVKLVRGAPRRGSSAGLPPGETVRHGGPIRETVWDPRSSQVDINELEGVDAFVNLAGVGIGDRRWTKAQKSAILMSRLESTRLVSETIARLGGTSLVLVNASAIGYYGDRGDEVLTEQSAGGSGFTAQVCKEWEAATRPAEDAGARVVRLRNAVVLSRDRGALARQLPLFRLGLGGRLGTGQQWFSWITLRDEISAICHLIDDAAFAGPVNLSSPNPVTNREFTEALGTALRRPTLVTAGRPFLRLALGAEMAQELLLCSQRVIPERLASSGFRFEDPTVGEALSAVLSAP